MAWAACCTRCTTSCGVAWSCWARALPAQARMNPTARAAVAVRRDDMVGPPPVEVAIGDPSGGLGTFVGANVADGSTVVSDGWSGYARLKEVKHDPRVVG